jgi:hypothetical protein
VKHNLLDDKPSYVKKAISNMRTDGEAFEIIKKACKQLNLSYECPGVINNIAVHFKIKKCNLAIIFSSTGPYVSRKVTLLKNSNWLVSVVHQHDVINHGIETIKFHLKDLIKKQGE